MKKKPEMKVVYHYIEPKNEAEVKEIEGKLDRAFDILFDEVDKKRFMSKGSKRDQ